MLVAVDPAALAGWAADARSTVGGLTSQLDQLDAAISPMAATWAGAAASGFDQHVAQWQHAAGDLLATLTDLAALVDTAHANYAAAAAANAQIWGAPVSGPAVVRAMSVGMVPTAIHAETDDIRSTVTALVAAADAVTGAWQRLAAALAGTAAMAGDDPVGAGFGHDVDATTAVAWQGWRSGAIVLGAVAGGLVATGNNLIEAESTSTAGSGRAAERITAAAQPVPGLPDAPSAVGDNGARSFVEPLAPNWPTASSQRLRDAAAAWRASAESVRDAAGSASSAVAGLVANNPDPALEQMRTFTDQVLSVDPTSGLLGALVFTCGGVAEACDIVAAATDRTRLEISDAVARAVGGEEWYDPVAAVLDAVLTRGAARIVAAGGHVLGLALDLDRIGSEHAATVAAIRANVSPAASDHLARLATALVPPTPVTAASCAVTAPTEPAGAPVAEADRRALIAEAQAEGKKLNPAEVLQIGRAPDGRIVWLERGGPAAGLGHILRPDRVRDFMSRGITPADIPTLAVRAVTQGTPMGRAGKDGVAFEVEVGGRRQEVVIVVGSNGFIVTAYPLNDRERLLPL